MKIKLLLILLIFSNHINILGQKCYVSYIEMDKVNDSLKLIIDKTAELRITMKYSPRSYKRDTILELPELEKISTLHIYKQDDKLRFYFVSPYIVLGPLEYDGSAITYFSLNDSAIFNSKYYPRIKSRTDSNCVFKVKEEHPEMADSLVLSICNFVTGIGYCCDCESTILTIFRNGKSKNLSFYKRMFQSDDSYYYLNSTLKSYTLSLILINELHDYADFARIKLSDEGKKHLSEKEVLKLYKKRNSMEKKRLERLQKELKKKTQ